MQRELIASSLLLLSTGSVMAAEWTSIIKDNQHEVLVDIDSYNTADNHPYLVAKTIYSKPQVFSLPDQKTKHSISIARIQFDCKKPLFRIRTIKLMDENSAHIDTIKINTGFQKLDVNTDEFSIGQLTCQVHQMLGGT